jgi:hypothetical protein
LFYAKSHLSAIIVKQKSDLLFHFPRFPLINLIKKSFMNISTTPVPNTLFDTYLKELKLAELKVLLIITRQTLGWEDKKTKSERKELDWISGSQLTIKTGCSKRAINSAIEVLVQKNLINVMSASGAYLDTPEKRRGQQKLFYCLSPSVLSPVENMGKGSLYLCFSRMTNANIAEDLRKKLTELTQKMQITKETI